MKIYEKRTGNVSLKYNFGISGSGGNLFETEAECEETCEECALERPFVDCKYSVGGDFDEVSYNPRSTSVEVGTPLPNRINIKLGRFYQTKVNIIFSEMVSH